MVGVDRNAIRAAAVHLDRHRSRIELEVNRELGRATPPAAVRSELIRRFRSYARLASVDWNAARPSLDGLSGNTARALERTISVTVDAASALGEEPAVREALRELGDRFRAGIRRVFAPREDGDGNKSRRKKKPNAGRRVRAAIDRISDAYVALCLETGTIYDINPAAETLFGGDSGALLKTEFRERVLAKDLPKFENLEARLDADEDSPPFDIDLVRLGGEAVPVELRIARHRIAGRRLAILSLRERTEAPAPQRDYSTRTTADAGILPTSTFSARST